MIIRWDDMRVDRSLIKEYLRELEFTLKNRIKGSCDIGLLLGEFEHQYSKYVGTNYTALLNSGTDAFQLILILLGIGKGDSVIVPNITYTTIPLIAMQKGVELILIDVKKEDLNINEDLIVKKIKKNTKAIIAVHMFGRVCNIEKLLQITKECRLFFIEDACQAFGSTYKNKKLGSFGDLSFFSFAFNKVLSSCGGWGGALCFNNSTYLKIVESFTQSHFDGFSHFKRDNRFMKMHFFDLISIKVKLKYIDYILKSRQQIKRIYSDELGKIKEIKIFNDKPHNISTAGLNFLIFAEERDSLVKWLHSKGISLVPWQYPMSVLHKSELFKKFASDKYPVSELYCKKAVYLPLFSFMKETEVRYVVNLVKRFYK